MEIFHFFISESLFQSQDVGRGWLPLSSSSSYDLHLVRDIFVFLHLVRDIFVFLHLVSDIFVFLHLVRDIFVFLHLLRDIFVFLFLMTDIFVFLHLVRDIFVFLHLVRDIFVYLHLVRDIFVILHLVQILRKASLHKICQCSYISICQNFHMYLSLYVFVKVVILAPMIVFLQILCDDETVA